MRNFKIYAGIMAGAVTIVGLGACRPQAEPTPAPTPDDAELNAFMDKLDADDKAEEAAIIAKNAREASERADESEARLRDYSGERRKADN